MRTPSTNRARTIAVLLAVSLIAVIGVDVQPAGAAAWTPMTTPSPAGPPRGELKGVACTATTNCVAVGSYVSSAGLTKTRIQTWNGTAWAAASSPNPSGSTESSLAAVSCSAANACTAVGSYASGDTAAPLIERWNGTTWTLQTVAAPVGSLFADLHGVSCPSATLCIAVGSYLNSNYAFRGFTAKWNGATWTAVASPHPLNAGSAQFAGVSCASTTSCIAVGTYQSGSGPKTFSEKWDGAAWTILTTPSPTGATTAQLDGISCTSTTNCFTVGRVDTGTGIRGLALRWNGTAWGSSSTPAPIGMAGWALTGVSCASTTACLAVGFKTTSLDVTTTFVERWNGTAWSTMISPNPSGSNDVEFAAVGCASATSCFGVGTSGSMLVEAYNGTAWSLSAPPVGSSQSALAAISCPGPTACFAAGTTVSNAGPKTLVQRWNGTTWATSATPTPAGAVDLTVDSISCASTTSCIAVGSWSDGSLTRPLSLKWDGTSWTQLTTPEVAGGIGSYLRGVSCKTATFCMAVGTRTTFDGVFTFVQRWNGTAWSILTSPTPATATGVDLRSVSCTGSTACMAVGAQQTSTGYSRTFAIRWNGTSWGVVTTPNPTGTVDSALNSVSCVSSSTCMAVGSNQPSVGELSLAMRWTGTSWVLVTTPNPAGAFATALRGVSCTAANACTAVGLSYNGNVASLAAMSWNGTAWALNAIANPAGSPDAALRGVACTAAAACVAAGSKDVTGSNLTLAMRYL